MSSSDNTNSSVQQDQSLEPQCSQEKLDELYGLMKELEKSHELTKKSLTKAFDDIETRISNELKETRITNELKAVKMLVTELREDTDAMAVYLARQDSTTHE